MLVSSNKEREQKIKDRTDSPKPNIQLIKTVGMLYNNIEPFT